MNLKENKKKQPFLLINIFYIVILILIGLFVHEIGILYLCVSLELIILLRILLIESVPVYLEKMIKNRIMKEQYKNVRKVKNTIFTYCFCVGLLISIILFGTSDFLATEVFQIKETALIIKLLAPSFFFFSMTKALLGYFQGVLGYTSTIIYEVLNFIFTISFSSLFSITFKQYGLKVTALLRNSNFIYMYTVIGIALGITIASILSTLFLLIIYYGFQKREQQKMNQGMKLSEDKQGILKQFSSLFLPTSLSTFFVRFPILFTIIFAINKNNSMSNMIGGLYLVLFLPLTLILFLLFMITNSNCKIITQAIKKEEGKLVKNAFSCGIKATILYAGFLTIFYSLIFNVANKLLFSYMIDSDAIFRYFFIGELSIFFYSIGLYFSKLMTSSMGAKKKALIISIIVCIVNILSLVIFNRFTHDMILSIMLALLLQSICYCLLSGFMIIKMTHYNIDFLRDLIIPVAIVSITKVSIIIMSKGLIPLIGEGFSLLFLSIIGFLMELILIFTFKCFKEKETMWIPMGKQLMTLGSLIHLV